MGIHACYLTKCEIIIDIHPTVSAADKITF